MTHNDPAMTLCVFFFGRCFPPHKQTTPQPTLPGTIHTVAAEIEALGVSALAVKLDVRDESSIESCKCG